MISATDARPTWQARALDAAFAPFHVLERARGRKQLALILIYFLIFCFVCIMVWRATSLDDLPDVGDPAVADEVARPNVPDDRNAWMLYEKAIARFEPLKANEVRRQTTLDWAKADPAIRAWAERNQEALSLWVEGTKRPDMSAVQPADLTFNARMTWMFDTRMTWLWSLRDLGRLAALERSRRQLDGDLDGAWEMNRAMLRCSRHVGLRGNWTQRLVGVGMLWPAIDGIERWAGDPGVGIDRLHAAMDEVEEVRRMSAPISEAIKLEHQALMKALDDAENEARRIYPEGIEDKTVWFTYLPGYHQARVFLLREPERSRRLARLATANLLAYCDLPPAQRPNLLDRRVLRIYDEDPAVARSSGRVDPRTLERFAIETAYLRRMNPTLSSGIFASDQENWLFNKVLVNLAKQCYRRRHAGKPPKRLGDLIGPDLKRLPEDFHPWQPARTTD